MTAVVVAALGTAAYAEEATPAELYQTVSTKKSRVDLSPFLDRMTYNDSVLANFLGELVAGANRLDPATPARIVVAQPPSFWVGYDYANRTRQVQFPCPIHARPAPPHHRDPHPRRRSPGDASPRRATGCGRHRRR